MPVSLLCPASWLTWHIFPTNKKLNRCWSYYIVFKPKRGGGDAGIRLGVLVGPTIEDIGMLEVDFKHLSCPREYFCVRQLGYDNLVMGLFRHHTSSFKILGWATNTVLVVPWRIHKLSHRLSALVNSSREKCADCRRTGRRGNNVEDIFTRTRKHLGHDQFSITRVEDVNPVRI